MSVETPRRTQRFPPSADGSGASRVLVVDDDEDVAKVYGKVLAGAGFDVVVRTDSTQAALEVVTQRFAAIVSDIAMPGMSGIDLLSVVRSYDADVPVILVTGNGTLETAMDAISLRSTEYLLKPVDPPALLRAVRKGIERVRPAPVVSVQPTHLLDSALEKMWLAFQPISSVRGKLYGYEALLRSDESALARPDLIIEAAKEADRLEELGRRVRAKASEAVPRVPDGVAIFVNLHVCELMDEELFDITTPLGRVASRIVLEVTERQKLDEVPDMEGRLARLRRMGFRIAIDDLGAGYSGLNSVVMLDPEIVKIDMALVRKVHESLMRQSVIQSLVDLARTTGIQVVAEGIETTEERDCIARLGCGLLQGYLLGRPARDIPG